MTTHHSSTRTLLQFGQIMAYGLLSVYAVLTLIPYFWLLCGSLKANEDFFSSLFLPMGDGFFGVDWSKVTLINFRKLITELDFGNHAMNSVFIASMTSILATLFAALGGYALSKFEFRMRTALTAIVLTALIIPGPLLIAPVYQLLHRLGLLNTYAGLILPAMAPAFGIFLFRQAMLNSVPKEMIEAARIDGCGEFRIFFTIVLPVVRPMIGAYLMISFLHSWNNFIGPQVILQSAEKFPLSVAIAQLKGTYQTDYGLIASGTIVSIIPVMVIFLLLQKEFISGLTSGAVKG
jgi:ABC-type glycerol-3-phosphate transport system permease component